MQIVIDIPEWMYKSICEGIEASKRCGVVGIDPNIHEAIYSGTPLPKEHGRLGDLDELEQRISNFVEHDAKITDEYTVVRQRFIVDGIRQTPTIIEADVPKRRKGIPLEENDSGYHCENWIP